MARGRIVVPKRQYSGGGFTGCGCVVPALLALVVIVLSCSDTPTEVPCDENSPDWPECHEQGSGSGGQ